MKSYVPSAKLEVIIAIPSSPTQISSTLIVNVETSGNSLMAKASLTLKALAGVQPLPSITLVMVTDCEAVVLDRSPAGIVNVPLPLLIVTFPVKPVAALGAARS